MIHSLITHRFTMNAEVLTWTGITQGSVDTVGQGIFETFQDPITGEFLNTWQPTIPVDNPVTHLNESADFRTIDCIARGIVDGGIRVAGTTERFGDIYQNVEFVKLWVPVKVVLTKRDQITNIRDKKNGTVMWKNEEADGGPTVFNVNGVTPLFDAFNRHIENYVLLERANNG